MINSPTVASPTGKLQTTLACRGGDKKFRIMVPAGITIGEFLELANTRTGRSDLRHVWVDGCEVPPGEDFQDHYTGEQLFYLTDTDSGLSNAELEALGIPVVEDLDRPPSPVFRKVTIELKPLTGQVVSIIANAEGTVDDLKNEISEKAGIALPIRLILPVKGSDGATAIVELENGHPLEEYGLEDGAKILQAVTLGKLKV
jgi:hypothetical protein